ncbi:hypothetical protein Tco_0417292, partial [Tanacetum coccineum]
LHRRLSDEFEFRKLLAEIDHEFGLDNSSQDEQDELEEVLYYAINDSTNISGKSGDVPTWFSDKDVDQGIDVETKDDPYHNVDEPEEISDMFADLDQALNELDQFCSIAYHVGLVVGDFIDQVGNVIPVEVVVEDKVAEETVVGSSGEDRDVVIPHRVYATMIAAEMLKDQTRAIKRRRVMADKEDKNNVEWMLLCLLSK